MLLDVNVWFALTFDLHPHHTIARTWLEQNENVPLHFCRVTQMSLLRLWTNAKATGDAVCTQREAWRLYQKLEADPGISFLDEPVGIEIIFRKHASRDEISPKRWTDDYLVAFAEAAGLTLVTFDKAMASRAPRAILLTP